MLPNRRRHRRRHALGMHEVPAPRHHREPGDRTSDAISLQHPGHGRCRGRHRLVRTEHLAELAQFLRPHHPAGRHRVHGFGGADLERLQVLLLPHLLRRQGAQSRAERHLQYRAEMALRLDRRGQSRRHHARHCAKMAVGDGDLGLRGRGSGCRQFVGPRSWPRPIRSAGDLAHLVARSPDRDQGRHDVCARNAARQKIPLRRAHRRNADREARRHRDRIELPGQADHRGRSAARLRRSRASKFFPLPLAGEGRARKARRVGAHRKSEASQWPPPYPPPQAGEERANR